MAAPRAEDAPRRGLLFRIPATPGVWLGFAGLALVVLAAALPWYSISARFPTAGYPDFTTIIQFDGINGLYVHPALKQNLGLSPPAIGFPFALLFALSSFLKVRKLIRSTTHKMRAATLFRSSIWILIPFIATILAITQIPALVPADAPQEVKDLGHAVAAQPIGGAAHFTFDVPIVGPQGGDLQWGFGPALWVMVAAAALMNLGSRLELYAYRKAHRELADEQALG